MLDFEVQRCTRHCAKTGRELRPGEVFYSVLVPEGSEVVRYDYCEEAWDGPPDGAIGWWKTQIPEAHAKKMHWAPNDVMIHYFQELEGRTDKEDVRYLLTLLMIRRRILRLEDTEKDPNGQEWMVVFCPRNETEYRIPVVMPDQQRIDAIQEELARLLFSNAA